MGIFLGRCGAQWSIDSAWFRRTHNALVFILSLEYLLCVGPAVNAALSLGRLRKRQVSLEGKDEKQEVGVVWDERRVTMGEKKRRESVWDGKRGW